MDAFYSLSGWTAEQQFILVITSSFFKQLIVSVPLLSQQTPYLSPTCGSHAPYCPPPHGPILQAPHGCSSSLHKCWQPPNPQLHPSFNFTLSLHSLRVITSTLWPSYRHMLMTPKSTSIGETSLQNFRPTGPLNFQTAPLECPIIHFKLNLFRLEFMVAPPHLWHYFIYTYIVYI